MKQQNKYKRLASITFGLGICFAFVPSLSSEPAYVRALMFEGEEWRCYSVNVTCSHGGINICSVAIPLRSGNIVIAASNAIGGAPLIYRAGCVQVLTGATDEYYNAPLTGNERPLQLLR